ncbi:class I SAM-dependent methyltransferase [Clostridium formicaceticum]|uniref:Glycine/sarcosine N-methyltransferase n=1 Tax=Clostridium formicaceticum TaxID=1497 RepID=A0AAC9WF11_9CLOT|nr:class I SAM-dependent methyltransferase [Clostridium formicaceticum]AOY75977.1 hypothetical protein BJL90_08735 [Clostridium formicaceticum]ARE86326.1 Glycine/sarcosine N-methyltransferase [Clostridium formicaceticum]
MGFYEEFSKYYDIVFPTGQAQLKFIQEASKNTDDKVLDIACGTGNYAIALAERGFQVSAIDLDEAMMKTVEEKARAKGVQLTTYVGDMRELGTYLQQRSFDLAFCIGNSLVHLTKLEEIQNALHQMHNILGNEGKLILQIINYDRIMKYSIDGLPTIEDREAGVKFVRKYNYDESKRLIYFNTELIVTKNGETRTFTNSVPLYPLLSHQLIAMLQIAGFKDVKLYGNFMEENYKEESYATVIIAEK